MKASDLRAKARADMTKEIKLVARRHLGTEGANLSLRAVARDMGMVSSALYRYFPSRDELLTALIIDAYNSLGAWVEGAESAVDATDLVGRWLAVGHAVRDWALRRPHEYALIYGSPVPGYRAPEDTVPAATRTAYVLGQILQDGTLSGVLPRAGQDERPPAAVLPDLVRLRATICPDASPAVLSRGLGAWTQLFGMVSFELFGQFRNTIENPRAFFEHQMRAQAAYIGL